VVVKGLMKTNVWYAHAPRRQSQSHWLNVSRESSHTHRWSYHTSVLKECLIT